MLLMTSKMCIVLRTWFILQCISLPRQSSHNFLYILCRKKLPHPLSAPPLLAPGSICPLCLLHAATEYRVYEKSIERCWEPQLICLPQSTWTVSDVVGTLMWGTQRLLRHCSRNWSKQKSMDRQLLINLRVSQTPYNDYVRSVVVTQCRLVAVVVSVGVVVVVIVVVELRVEWVDPYSSSSVKPLWIWSVLFLTTWNIILWRLNAATCSITSFPSCCSASMRIQEVLAFYEWMNERMNEWIN